MIGRFLTPSVYAAWIYSMQETDIITDWDRAEKRRSVENMTVVQHAYYMNTGVDRPFLCSRESIAERVQLKEYANGYKEHSHHTKKPYLHGRGEEQSCLQNAG